MNLKSVRLVHRLGCAFGIVVLLSLLSDGIALLKLREIQSNLDRIVTVNDVKADLNTRMASSVHIVSRVVRTMALLDDDAARQGQAPKIVSANSDYDKARSELDAFAPTERGRELRKAIDDAASTARPLNAQFLQLVMAGKAAEATELLTKQAMPHTQRWQDAIAENFEAQRAQNADAYKTARSEYESALALLIASAAVSVVVAAGLAFVVVRSVISELGAEPSEVALLAQSIADADLRPCIKLAAGDSTSIMAAMQRMQKSLVGIVASVRSNAEGVATASAQIAQGNADLSQRTEEQASALQQTAATMEQLGTTVRHTAENAHQANQLAATATSIATKGNEAVGDVVRTMRDISEASKKISDIIGVIDGIAFQTNILALNAAVEAARAGEQGRGFAVVASEVRSLAQRSGEAAKEIKTLINASVEQMERGASQADIAGSTMDEIVASIHRVSAIVEEISAATTEQSLGVGQVGQAVAQMDQTTQQNSALVEESAAAAESLRSQADDMVRTVAVFEI